jgi:hypothetical protein
MRAIVPAETAISGGSKAPATLRRAIKKTSASSALRRENHGGEKERKNSAPPLQVELLCRDDTTGFDPFWDAPRLLPTFVAQLLGQVMPEQRVSISVESAYGRTGWPRPAPLVDRKS